MQPQHINPKTMHPRLIWRAALACVLSMALVLVGFGHRPVQAEPQAMAYLLAGGDWADLCADGPAPHPAGDTCAACILAKGMALSAPVTAPRALLGEQRLVWTPRAAERFALTIAATYPARAPPFDDRATPV